MNSHREHDIAFLGADPSAGAAGAGVGHANRGHSYECFHLIAANSKASIGYIQDERKGAGGFWTVEYYQAYFDVDTQTVLKRCYSTLLPTSSNYLSTHLVPAADLYGPFWSLTTLIFTLFLSSSLAQSISAYLSTDDPSKVYDYDFTLLSLAMTLVYAYGIAVPVLLWMALRYIGVGEWSVIEALAVWGYGQFVWIPVSVRRKNLTWAHV
jgi:protein YIPF1/2